MNEYITLDNLKQYDKGLLEHILKNKRYNFWTDKAEAATKSDDVVYFTTDSKLIMKNGEIFGGAEASDNSVKYSDFNKNECSLTLGYDADGKLEIQVVRDLSYELKLTANPTYIWYGSDPTIAFTVTANDYTKGATGWTFSAPAITSASYPALGPKETKTFSKAYADITADITGTLTQGTTSTVTVLCRKPIICSTSDIAANDRFTDFTKNAGYANQLGDFTFSGYIPAVTPLYIGVPGNKTYIKYKSGTSDNEAPRSKQVNISINGQSLSYSIFECNVTTGAEFKIYE